MAHHSDTHVVCYSLKKTKIMRLIPSIPQKLKLSLFIQLEQI